MKPSSITLLAVALLVFGCVVQLVETSILTWIVGFFFDVEMYGTFFWVMFGLGVSFFTVPAVITQVRRASEPQDD